MLCGARFTAKLWIPVPRFLGSPLGLFVEKLPPEAALLINQAGPFGLRLILL